LGGWVPGLKPRAESRSLRDKVQQAFLKGQVSSYASA
jgi:hypothetical protein